MSLPAFAIQNSAPEFVQNAIDNCQKLCYYVDGTAMAVPGAVTQRNCTSQQIMDTKAKIIKHKKIDHRAPVVGA